MPTVSITSPAGSSSVPFPLQVTGTAQPSAGNKLVAMGYQIDNGGAKGLPTPQPGNWSFTLTAMDCPMVGSSYLLSVHVGDDGPGMASDSVTFIRQS